MNEIDQETVETRNKILAQWNSMDDVLRSAEVLSNSDFYKLAKYAETTPIAEQEYYINSEGNLTTWTLDPSIQKLTLSDFISKPQSSNLVADKQV